MPQGADREVQRPKRGGVQDGVPAGLLVQDVQLTPCWSCPVDCLKLCIHYYSIWGTSQSSGARGATKFGSLDCYVDCLKLESGCLIWMVDQFSGIRCATKWLNCYIFGKAG